MDHFAGLDVSVKETSTALWMTRAGCLGVDSAVGLVVHFLQNAT
jgi:hypothetical protein